MAKGILGRKVGMTQVYDDRGKIVPVTVIQAGPCHVLQLRTLERDGYEAVQLGYLDKPRRLARRSERGHVAKLASKRARKTGGRRCRNSRRRRIANRSDSCANCGVTRRATSWDRWSRSMSWPMWLRST